MTKNEGLSSLIEAGVGSARLVFGGEGTAISAATLLEAGSRYFGSDGRGDAIGALLTNDQPTIELLYGAILNGCRLVSFPLPGRSADAIEYGQFIRDECDAFGISHVVARDDAAVLLDAIGVPTLAHSQLQGHVLAEPSQQGFSLVQYSSGSTGRPKAIELSDDALGINVLAMLHAVEPGPGDVTVSWLPLSHDLGLVGMLLTSTAAGSPSLVGCGEIVLLEPEQFLRRPRIWLDALARWSGSFTASPDFGYRLVARRRPPGHVNLSRLRCAIVGGEIVRADTLDLVTEAFRQSGLPPTALCPSYGMAELGLAASISPPRETPRVATLGLEALANRQRVAAREAETSMRLVSSGPALAGWRVTGSTDPGTIGPLRIAAPAIGRNPHSNRSYADDDGILTTGDVGFVDDDGWVYVCGRSDDHITANGRSLYAPALEAAISDVPGVRHGRVTVVDAPTGDWLIAVEGLSALDPSDELALVRAIRRAAMEAASIRPTEVAVLQPGGLPMTSSGKVQRGEVRQRWMTGLIH